MTACNEPCLPGASHPGSGSLGDGLSFISPAKLVPGDSLARVGVPVNEPDALLSKKLLAVVSTPPLAVVPVRVDNAPFHQDPLGVRELLEGCGSPAHATSSLCIASHGNGDVPVGRPLPPPDPGRHAHEDGGGRPVPRG